MASLSLLDLRAKGVRGPPQTPQSWPISSSSSSSSSNSSSFAYGGWDGGGVGLMSVEEEREGTRRLAAWGVDLAVVCAEVRGEGNEGGIEGGKEGKKLSALLVYSHVSFSLPSRHPVFAPFLPPFHRRWVIYWGVQTRPYGCIQVRGRRRMRLWPACPSWRGRWRR